MHWTGEPLGENLLRGDLAKDWNVEQHETAKMTMAKIYLMENIMLAVTSLVTSKCKISAKPPLRRSKIRQPPT